MKSFLKILCKCNVKTSPYKDGFKITVHHFNGKIEMCFDRNEIATVTELSKRIEEKIIKSGITL